LYHFKNESTIIPIAVSIIIIVKTTSKILPLGRKLPTIFKYEAYSLVTDTKAKGINVIHAY